MGVGAAGGGLKAWWWLAAGCPMQQEVLVSYVAASIEQLSTSADPTTFTFRQIKAAIKARAQLSDQQWESVLQEHKAFLKEEARRQLDLRVQAQQKCSPGQNCEDRGKAKTERRKTAPVVEHGEQKKRRTGAPGCKTHVTTSYQPVVEEVDSCEICKRPGDDDKILLVRVLLRVPQATSSSSSRERLG